MDVDEVQTIHWNLNVREVQTNAEVVLKSGQVMAVANLPREPLLEQLRKLGYGILPCSWVKRPEDD